MPLPSANIEREFTLIHLALYLQQHSDKAATLAINHYENYMDLADDYKQLRKDFEALQIENVKLKSASDARISPRLPSFSIRLNRR